MPSGKDTIHFVGEHTQIPVPKVRRYWIEDDRSFLILECVSGQTLRDAWSQLTPDQQNALVDEVAGYCVIMTSIKSSRFESASGGAVLESYQALSSKFMRPLLGPSSLEERKQPFGSAFSQVDETSIIQALDPETSSWKMEKSRL